MMRVRWRRPGGWREGPGSARWFVSMCEPRSTDSYKGQFCYHKFSVLGTGAHCHLKRMSASSKKGFERFKIKYAYVLFVVRERSGVGRGGGLAGTSWSPWRVAVPGLGAATVWRGVCPGFIDGRGRRTLIRRFSQKLSEWLARIQIWTWKSCKAGSLPITSSASRSSV